MATIAAHASAYRAPDLRKAEPAKAHSKKLKLFILGYTVSLALLAGFGYLFADFSMQGEQRRAATTLAYHTDISYVDLPRVNLSVASGNSASPGRIRLDLSLEVDKKYMGRVEDIQPRISDRIVNYLRDLDFDSLAKPSAVTWLHQKLLEQASAASYPLPIKDVVLQQFLVM